MKKLIGDIKMNLQKSKQEQDHLALTQSDATPNPAALTENVLLEVTDTQTNPPEIPSIRVIAGKDASTIGTTTEGEQFMAALLQAAAAVQPVQGASSFVDVASIVTLPGSDADEISDCGDFDDLFDDQPTKEEAKRIADFEKNACSYVVAVSNIPVDFAIRRRLGNVGETLLDLEEQSYSGWGQPWLNESDEAVQEVRATQGKRALEKSK